MIVLDTNVISELMKVHPQPVVMDWIDATPSVSLFVAAVSKAELLYGVAILPAGRRRDGFQQAVRLVFDVYFRERVLPFDDAATEAYAVLSAARRQAGKPISQFDAQIAAIAQSRGAVLATRNVADFTECGIEIVNPWIAMKA